MKINNVLVVSLPNVDGYAKKIAIEQVCKTNVGFLKVNNTQEFIDVLLDKSILADLIVVDGHGECGKFITSYDWEENVSVENVFNSFNRENCIVLSCACETFIEQFAEILFRKNITYIAPQKEIEHTSEFAFVVRFVYELINNERGIKESFKLASEIDNETQIFKLIAK